MPRDLTPATPPDLVQTGDPVPDPATFRLRLVAPCSHAGGLAPVLARQLGISPARIAERLVAGTGVLADGMPAGRARRLVPVLRALGIAVTAEDSRGGGVDLAILPGSRHSLPALAAVLAPVLNRDRQAVEAGLGVPGGLILPDLAPPEAVSLRARLAQLGGLRIVMSDPEAAVYDLYQVGPLGAGDCAALLADLRRLGLGPCLLTGALASGMDRRMANWLQRRHADSACRVLNRAFQTFDVLLTGLGRLPAPEVADFLSARRGLPRSRIAALSAGNPLRIEAGLRHEVARQFMADYAAIGLQTRLKLAHT